jgi:anti-anti-sigma factor
MTTEPGSSDFTIERHGEVTVIVPSPALENMDPGLIEEVAEVLLEPIRNEAMPLVVIDLREVSYFGSAFLSLILRCWRQANARGGQVVLCGVSARVRELLHLTSLDIVWPIYPTRREAIEALSSD